MVNLIKFKSADHLQRFATESQRTSEYIGALEAERVFGGMAGPEFCADEDWDLVLLIRYPNFASVHRVLTEERPEILDALGGTGLAAASENNLQTKRLPEIGPIEQTRTRTAGLSKAARTTRVDAGHAGRGTTCVRKTILVRTAFRATGTPPRWRLAPRDPLTQRCESVTATTDRPSARCELEDLLVCRSVGGAEVLGDQAGDERGAQALAPPGRGIVALLGGQGHADLVDRLPQRRLTRVEVAGAAVGDVEVALDRPAEHGPQVLVDHACRADAAQIDAVVEHLAENRPEHSFGDRVEQRGVDQRPRLVPEPVLVRVE
jgi:hypothetical protein